MTAWWDMILWRMFGWSKDRLHALSTVDDNDVCLNNIMPAHFFDSALLWCRGRWRRIYFEPLTAIVSLWMLLLLQFLPHMKPKYCTRIPSHIYKSFIESVYRLSVDTCESTGTLLYLNVCVEHTFRSVIVNVSDWNEWNRKWNFARNNGHRSLANTNSGLFIHALCACDKIRELFFLFQ